MLAKRTIGTVLVATAALPAAAAERQVTLAVDNMTCALCQITVARAIEAVPGVDAVAVDTVAHTATVPYDDARAGVLQLATAATNAGYPARVVE
jgi:mercuric ion binding protein